MSAPSDDLQPVDGLVIPRSTGKTLGLIFLALVLFPFACLLIWGKIQNVVYGVYPDDKKVTWYGLLFGIVGVIGAPIMVYQLSRSLVVRRRLVIGEDRLQILECHNGKDMVVFQIPFANIAEVEYEVTATERRVGIDLKDPDDPATRNEGYDFRISAKNQGRHYCITEAFQGGAHEIADEIKRAMKMWSEG